MELKRHGEQFVNQSNGDVPRQMLFGFCLEDTHKSRRVLGSVPIVIDTDDSCVVSSQFRPSRIKCVAVSSDRVRVMRTKANSKSNSFFRGIGSILEVYPSSRVRPIYKSRRLSSLRAIEQDWLSLAGDMAIAVEKLKARYGGKSP
jgi:transcriptional regulator of nitric oxide reductase